MASRTGVTLADVEEAVSRHEPHGIPGETLFADHCHLNDRGKDVWLDVYTAAVARVLAVDAGP